MSTHDDITKQKQQLANYEQSLALEKIKKRRADIRCKIELGGLVIKSGMHRFNKSVILGALDYVFTLLEQDASYERSLEVRGNDLFLDKNS